MYLTSFLSLRHKGVVGMNYRNIELIGRYNSRRNYPLVDNKLATKEIAKLDYDMLSLIFGLGYKILNLKYFKKLYIILKSKNLKTSYLSSFLN